MTIFGQVCVLSVALPWFSAAVVHNSRPEVPQNIGEKDFNARQVDVQCTFAYIRPVDFDFKVNFSNVHIQCNQHALC